MTSDEQRQEQQPNMGRHPQQVLPVRGWLAMFPPLAQVMGTEDGDIQVCIGEGRSAHYYTFPQLPPKPYTPERTHPDDS